MRLCLKINRYINKLVKNKKSFGDPYFAKCGDHSIHWQSACCLFAKKLLTAFLGIPSPAFPLLLNYFPVSLQTPPLLLGGTNGSTKLCRVFAFDLLLVPDSPDTV